MATGKRYFWMKLKESFMTSDTIDYFMGLPDGANYVVLYQMLCLKTINTEGRFERQIGAMLIPYDVEKIRRDTKWFSTDTIRVALNLYKQFGLIYEDVNGVLVIAGHSELVGSETDYTSQKRRQIAKKNVLLPPESSQGVETGVENFHSNVHENVHIENRDKSLEIRDESLDTREQISDSNSSISIDDDDSAEAVVTEFARDFGRSIDGYSIFQKVNSKTREKVATVTRTLFEKAVGTPPTEMDEANVFRYITELGTDNRISNDRIYILTCAFYKAAEAGHRGQWNYIESILSDMQYRGVTTKEQAKQYFYTGKDDD